MNRVAVRPRHALRLESLEERDVPAGVIVSPVSATVDAGGPGFGSINDTLNQNGLASRFTSGETDFDTYIATSPSHTSVFAGNEWFSNRDTTGATVTYDLGSVLTIDRLALWNEESSGVGSLSLLSSTDGVTFVTLAPGLRPTDNPLANYRADVFAFTPTLARYVRFAASQSPQPNPATFPAAAIGEVAFRAADDVAIDINGTAAQDDDITLLNGPRTRVPFVQDISIRVTNNGAAGTISLSVEPATAGTLSQTELNIPAGGSLTIRFTPTPVSAADNDVDIVARRGVTEVDREDLTVVSVIIPDIIRNSNTPSRMRDRIPPRVDTGFNVVVTPDLAGSGQSVRLAFPRQAAFSGRVTVNGAEAADITTTGTVNLRGTEQTRATGRGNGVGNAGRLRLIVQVRGMNTAFSQGFSVAAIPVERVNTFDRLLTGSRRGFYVTDTYVSDSGVVGDLDEILVSEVIQPGPGTGVMEGIGVKNRDIYDYWR